MVYPAIFNGNRAARDFPDTFPGRQKERIFPREYKGDMVQPYRLHTKQGCRIPEKSPWCDSLVPRPCFVGIT